ncbi:hypothetical protein PM082_013629 [Marasmius tenuissimus]|nr:hypothetical protein PM082_013629 [Marasmius tenuissimus]
MKTVEVIVRQARSNFEKRLIRLGLTTAFHRSIYQYCVSRTAFQDTEPGIED